MSLPYRRAPLSSTFIFQKYFPRCAYSYLYQRTHTNERLKFKVCVNFNAGKRCPDRSGSKSFFQKYFYACAHSSM
jgi:hypothetical protein